MAVIYDTTPDPAEVYAAVRRMWDFSNRVPVPTGAVELSCKLCGGGDLLVRSWRFFERGGGATLPYRCDLSLKCLVCSAIATFGIVTPEDHFVTIPRQWKGTTIYRKQAIDRGWFTDAS